METKIRHYENGDSEFTFPITMVVGASDTGSSTVTIGSGYVHMVLTIYQEDEHEFQVYDSIKHISDRMNSKEACINWIINQLKVA